MYDTTLQFYLSFCVPFPHHCIRRSVCIGLGSEDLCEELEDVHHVRGHVVEAGQLGRHAAAHGLAAALLRGEQPPPLLLRRPQPGHQVLLQPEREKGGLEGS